MVKYGFFEDRLTRRLFLGIYACHIFNIHIFEKFFEGNEKIEPRLKYLIKTNWIDNSDGIIIITEEGKNRYESIIQTFKEKEYRDFLFGRL